jgi:hypothetical protein
MTPGCISDPLKYLFELKNKKKLINISHQKLKNTPKGNFAAALLHTYSSFENVKNVQELIIFPIVYIICYIHTKNWAKIYHDKSKNNYSD